VLLVADDESEPPPYGLDAAADVVDELSLLVFAELFLLDEHPAATRAARHTSTANFVFTTPSSGSVDCCRKYGRSRRGDFRQLR
jgi:hypothetical protein